MSRSEAARDLLRQAEAAARRGSTGPAVAAIRAAADLSEPRDALTGLPRRPDARAREAVGEERVVAFVDMDGLKAVNDSLGHAVGDEMIWRCAAAVRLATREGDAVYRWGGDEIVAVLGPGAAARLDAVERRIRAELAAAGVSASVGVTVACQGETLDAALDRADRHMYAQKRERHHAMAYGREQARGWAR